MVKFYFFQHPVGHQVTDRFSLLNDLTYMSRRDFKQGCFSNVQAGIQPVDNIETGAFVDVQVVVFYQYSSIFPFVQVLQAVAAQYYGEYMLRVFFFQVGEVLIKEMQSLGLDVKVGSQAPTFMESVA